MTEIASLLLGLSILIEASLFRAFKSRQLQPERILVIRLDGIGDFVLWLGAAQALRKIYPKKHITLLATSTWASLAAQQDIFDEVWAVDRTAYRRKPAYRWKLWQRIADAGFGLVLQPTYSREFYFGDILVWISGAKTSIGWDGDLANQHGWQKRISDHWYTRLVRSERAATMEIQRNAEFVRALGLTDFKAGLPHVSKKGVAGPVLPRSFEDYFVVFPGAAWGEKCWPAERWVEITRRVRALTGWAGVVCGSDVDKKHTSELVSEGQCIDLVGRTTLEELVEVIGRSRLVLTNDTSAVHIASAQEVRTICVVGGGHFGRFLPYIVDDSNVQLPSVVHHDMDCFGCNWRCIYSVTGGHAYPCIEWVSVEDVWRAIEATLGGKTRASAMS